MNVGITSSHPINLPTRVTHTTLVAGRGLAAILVALYLHAKGLKQAFLYKDGLEGVHYEMRGGGLAAHLLREYLPLSYRLRLLRSGSRILLDDQVAVTLLHRLPLVSIPLLDPDRFTRLEYTPLLRVNLCPERLPDVLVPNVRTIGVDGCISNSKPFMTRLGGPEYLIVTGTNLDETIEVLEDLWGSVLTRLSIE